MALLVNAYSYLVGGEYLLNSRVKIRGRRLRDWVNCKDIAMSVYSLEYGLGYSR
jgi:hypothetical protein